MPGAGIPIIGAVADVITGGMQNQANIEAVNNTNYYNAIENQKNRDWNLKMWQMQNEYNTPAAQMARDKAAGLNTNLMYSQGNTGNAGPVAASSPVKFQAPSVTIPQVMPLIQAIQGMELQNEQIAKAKYDTGIAKENYKAGHLQNENMYGWQANAYVNPIGEGVFNWVTPDIGQKSYDQQRRELELQQSRAGLQSTLLGNQTSSKNLGWIDLLKKSEVDSNQLGNILKGQEANIKGELNRYNMTSSDWFLFRLAAALLNKGVDAAKPSGRRDYVQRY